MNIDLHPSKNNKNVFLTYSIFKNKSENHISKKILPTTACIITPRISPNLRIVLQSASSYAIHHKFQSIVQRMYLLDLNIRMIDLIFQYKHRILYLMKDKH